MATGDAYRTKAAEFQARARCESDGMTRLHFESLARDYEQLAKLATQVDVIYKRPKPRAVAFIPTDVKSIICRHCGGKADLIRREPRPADVEGEMLTFKCEKCGKESKTIVQA